MDKLFVRFTFLLVFTLAIVVCNGQSVQDKRAIAVKMEKIKADGQFETNAIRFEAERKLNNCKSSAKDSLNMLQLQGQFELDALQREAQQSMDVLMAKASRGMFNGQLRQAHFEKKFAAIEREFGFKIASLESKYGHSINKAESYFTRQMEEIINETQLKLFETESRYKKELVDLEMGLE